VGSRVPDPNRPAVSTRDEGVSVPRTNGDDPSYQVAVVRHWHPPKTPGPISSSCRVATIVGLGEAKRTLRVPLVACQPVRAPEDGDVPATGQVTREETSCHATNGTRRPPQINSKSYVKKSYIFSLCHSGVPE
jgi:hypothetical protein